jgi:hypothetical protein
VGRLGTFCKKEETDTFFGRSYQLLKPPNGLPAVTAVVRAKETGDIIAELADNVREDQHEEPPP